MTPPNTAPNIRFRIILALLAASLAAFFASGQVPQLGAPAPAQGDCAEIAIWSNGAHSSIALRADQLPTGHPLRVAAQGETQLLIGWCDAGAYQSRGEFLGADFLIAANALIPGGETTVHLVAGEAQMRAWGAPKTLRTLAISRQGVAPLAAYLTESLALNAAGEAQTLAQTPHGAFLRGRKWFHLFNVCNQWTARALRRAGVDLIAAPLWTAEMLVFALRTQPRTCAEVK